MSRQARAWIFSGLLGLGAAGLYLLGDGTSAPERLEALVGEPAGVTALRLTPAEGESLHLLRRGEGFVLTAPVKTPADPQRVEALLEQLAALGTGEPVAAPETASGGDLPASFGLARPLWRLELDTATGTRILEVGAASPFDGRRYLRVDETDLRLVSTRLLSRLDARPRYWREKRPVPEAPESIDRLRLTTSEFSFGLVREGERWEPEPEDPGAGDGVARPLPSAGVRALIRDLTELRAVAFGDQLSDLPPQKTPAEATLELGFGGEPRRLEFFSLGEDASGGVLVRGTPLDGWVRLRPGAFETLRSRVRALSPD